ncbi:alanine racemase [Leifsonia sp. AK011]|uniref:alanine racemase C-terminal domain-containing protein n=1 Tax=Leifsonia sp. AK011 TaxID=2723075 RepID=UPI0015CB191F|nr:alanine racemase C-terminal domain-containing protein [Leifsonia sp. AK011]NYF10843.1 alanine racemase [Leifsonia sp. AK011]
MNQGSAAAGHNAPAGLRRIARIDLNAFTSNITRLLADEPGLVLDARANAYGHGAERIVRAALDAGVTTVRVSPRDGALPGIRRSALMTVPSVRPLVAEAAYGLDGESEPVMTVVGEVIAVKPTEAGAGVSYGYTYRTESNTTLALVGLGYADGVPRLSSNRASVTIGHSLLPLVGRVAMDQFVVDCGDVTPSVGDEVTLWGVSSIVSPTAIEWAEQTERSPLELTAGLANRVERVYS